VRPRGPRVRRQGSRPGRDGIRRTGVRLGELVRQVFRALRAVVALAAVLALLLYATYAPFRGQVNSQAMMVVSKVQGIFVTRYVPVHPVKVTATAEQPGHPAAMVADNATNTYWSAATGGVEPALVLTFDHPVDLRRALVRVGVGSDFQSTHRPQRLHLVYSTGKTDDVSLTDTPDQQEVALGNSAGATSVELHVVSLFRSLRGNDVAISEIELFERG
jgi:hypothetical protein